jgi:hypothetical protein
MRMLSVVRRPHPAQVLGGCYRLARFLLVPFELLGAWVDLVLSLKDPAGIESNVKC